jgi:hypothetical protein
MSGTFTPSQRFCLGCRVLSDAVVAAMASVYRAKGAYESAKSRKASNVGQLAADLAVARKSERVAAKALEDHVKEHGGSVASTTTMVGLGKTSFRVGQRSWLAN